MPDGHQGYGLSIGGVLATEEAVIPYGVGVDIGCRMALTVYPLRDMENNSELSKAIDRCTIFGAGQERKRSDNLNKYIDDEVVQRDIFNTTNLLRGLKEKAARQLGTSGSGNHFVEFGLVKFGVDDLLPAGKYMGLLTHSGSRGLGARIADYYTKAAKRLRKLDPEVANLAWLMMDEEEGMEYWEAMNLAGDYAKACHDAIHTLVAKVIKETPLVKIENHHNFAWRENHDGKDLIVHRKGATPAGKGVMGIIPGSMATAGYVVRGRGHAESLHSASHGAGRLMSRTKAKQSFIWSDVKEDLTNKHITLMGAGLDECSGAYKDINAVMGYQTDLVDIVASFMPKIVKMAGADEEPED
jgi:tRNA-splicing ligase RtcB